MMNVQALSTPCVNKSAVACDCVTMQSVWWLPCSLMCAMASAALLTISTVILASVTCGSACLHIHVKRLLSSGAAPEVTVLHTHTVGGAVD